ncbi:HNH endonuclease family protein [Picrophilus oshimae]|uniref:HNH endonuclease family protein n=1 Tax=Picrophilus oshimae TaxID=46632 RepID=UPI0009FC614A
MHKDYLNRLGNLTITGYNQNLSNATFKEKKNKDNGYKDSSIRITSDLMDYEIWGPPQIEERGKKMAKRIAETWKI